SGWPAAGAEARAVAGSPVSAADVNGDGFDDLVTNSPTYDVGAVGDAGRSEVYLGTCGSLDADGDGVAPPGAAGCLADSFTDCNDADGGAWTTPGEVGTILFAPDKSTLGWGPVGVGGTPSGTVYDSLRSPAASD